jgi:hypothetical protein
MLIATAPGSFLFGCLSRILCILYVFYIWHAGDLAMGVSQSVYFVHGHKYIGIHKVDEEHI